jgi:thiopeptide-type bacteriocin biosynthesis protein
MRPASFFVVRSPLLEGSGDGAARPIEQLVRSPIVREALERASRSLSEALDGKRQSRVDVWPSVTRYVERMRERCTPFSLMAGYAWGATGGATTEVRFVARERYRRIVRVDVNSVVRAVSDKAHAAPHDAQWVAPRALARFGDVIKVAMRDGEAVRLVDVDRSEALERALEAAQRPVPLAAVVDAVAPFAPGGRAEAERFVSSLIDERLLVPAATPPVLVASELEALERLGGDDARLAGRMRAVRSTALGEAVQLDTPATVELIFDLVKPTEKATLGEDVLGALRTVLRALPRMTPGRPANPRLDDFRRRFAARYEGREVPLVEAADPRRGLGFPLEPPSPAPTQGGGDLREWLLWLYDRACRSGSEVELRESDLLQPVRWSLQESFAVAFALARDPVTLWDVQVGGAPGTLFLARATAVLPDEFGAHVAGFVARAAQDQPDVDVADVAFFIPGRSAAFTQYPLLTPMELTLTPTTQDPARSLDVNDLLVSVPDGTVRLRSRTTGRYVLVRRSGAANPNRPDTTELYRLLCEIGTQDGCDARWSWETLVGAPRLPRVSYEGHVLSPAEWNLRPSETEPLRKAKTREQRWDVVQGLRRTRALPRRLLFQENADLLLPVDLDDPGSVEAFADIATERVRFLEAFPVERSAVAGPEGPYHHQFVVPFLGEVARAAVPAASATPAVAPPEVVFDRVLPGGSPLYVSFWGDADELLSILRDVVDEVVRPLEAERRVTHWFFLPFSDPDPHVRLRLFGDPARLWDGSTVQAVRAVLDPLVRMRVLSRVSLETYDRETYRYGGPRGVELAERVFHGSSEMALALHEHTAFDGEDAAEAEAMLVVYVASLRGLLDATGLPVEEQRAVARATAAGYARNEDANVLRKRAADLYRRTREPLSAWSTQMEGAPRAWLDALRPVLAEARSAPMATSFSRWLGDCLHVHSVRLLTTWHQADGAEATAYHVLEKLLGTEIALAKERPA